MAFRSRRRFHLRRSRPAMHWVPGSTFGAENAVTAGTVTASGVASSTGQIGATFVENNRCTVYRIRGQVLYRNTSATGIALITCGIIVAPVDTSGSVDVTDYDPTVAANQSKPWLWTGACYLAANNVSVNSDSWYKFDLDVKSKRVLSQSALVFVTKYTAVVAGATVSIVHNIRTLVGRIG